MSKNMVLLGAGIAAVVLLVLYRNRQAFNPTSDKNLAYLGASSVVGVLSDDPNQTLGGWISDVFHPHAGLADDEEFYNGVIRKRPNPATPDASWNGSPNPSGAW